MKRRTKVLIAVGAGAVVMLSAGALMLRPPVPYDFLRGARFDGVRTATSKLYTQSKKGVVSGPVTIEEATRRYWLPQPHTEVVERATGELKPMGWTMIEEVSIDPVYAYYQNTAGETVHIQPAEGGGCTIHLITKPTTIDRVESWMWRQTHPSEGRRPAAAVR